MTELANTEPLKAELERVALDPKRKSIIGLLVIVWYLIASIVLGYVVYLVTR